MNVNVSSKVTAASVAAAVASYVVGLLTDSFGVAVPADLRALITAAVVSVVTFGVGFGKRELAKLGVNLNAPGFDAPTKSEAAPGMAVPEVAPAKADVPAAPVAAPEEPSAGVPETGKANGAF